MKIRNSLRSAKTRDKNCRVVRRHGKVYVIPSMTMSPTLLKGDYLVFDRDYGVKA